MIAFVRHLAQLSALVLCLIVPIASTHAAETKPVSSLSIFSDDMLELHGEIYGQPYWIRLLSPDQRFGGNRIMQLVYVPRKPEENGTTVNEDHPFLLLNSKAQIIAWNERGSGLSGFEYRSNRKEPGYAINIERSRTDTKGDLVPIEVRADFASPSPLWDGHLAPLMLALTYQVNDSNKIPSAAIPSADFFAAKTPTKPTPLIINNDHITLPNGQSGTISTDDQGRLKAITNDEGQTIFSVSAWLSDPKQDSQPAKP